MDTNPYAPPEAQIADDPATQDVRDLRLEVTWVRASKVLWSFIWRWMVRGMLVGACGDSLVKVFARSMEADPVTIRDFSALAGFGGFLGAGVWSMKIVMRKSWSDFRIVLQPRNPGNRPNSRPERVPPLETEAGGRRVVAREESGS